MAEPVYPPRGPKASGAAAPELSILIISYETREMTLACLASVFAETRADFEVIVVDNASHDGSAAAIAAAYADEPRLRLIAEPRNHGFSGANNLAAKDARGEFLLLLNPDTVVLDGALDRLLAFARSRPEARIWGGRTVFADGALNPSSCWARPTAWSAFARTSGLTGLFPRSALCNPEAYGGWDRGDAREVDIVVGCLLLIRRETWAALGGLDPAFVMYGEEADLCLRARRALGARPAITPEATIIHHGGASERVRADRVVRILAGKASVMRRHLAGPSRALALWFHKLWPLTRWGAASAIGALPGRKGEGAAVWREVWARRAEWAEGWPGT